MKKSDELKLEINEKRRELEKLQREQKWTEGSAVADELNRMVDECKATIALENSEMEKIKNSIGKNFTTPILEDEKKLRNRAFNKLVLNPARTEPIPLTEEERAAYYNVSGSPGQPAQIGSIETKGGYLVPQEEFATLQEFRKGFVALKDYVTLINVNSTSGRWATFTPQNLKFQKFAEMTDIAERDINFGEAKYLIEDWGLTIPISKQLVNDANIDILGFMGRQLMEGVISTENEEILTPLETLITGDAEARIAEATTITTYKALNTAMFKTLDGVYYNSTKIFTNQDGFLWLSNLEDAHNRPLFVPDVTQPNKYFYRGKEIVMIPNSTLPNTTIDNKNYAPFFIGDMKSYITFFERQGLELLADKSIYFKKYGVALQGVVRFGVTVTDKNAMTALKVEV